MRLFLAREIHKGGNPDVLYGNFKLQLFLAVALPVLQLRLLSQPLSGPAYAGPLFCVFLSGGPHGAGAEKRARDPVALSICAQAVPEGVTSLFRKSGRVSVGNRFGRSRQMPEPVIAAVLGAF